MSGNEWFAVDVVVDPDASEAVESAFNNVDCLGTETDTWKKTSGEPIRISGFFNRPPDLVKIENCIKGQLALYALAPDAIKSVSSRTIQQTDWLAEWKKHWKPVHVGNFVIAPPWAAVAPTDKHIIRIEPNMAFGTGTHETTQLCLKAISEHLRPGESFLDVGTGTGILAIAAAMLGAEPIIACDTDADSIKIATENTRSNGVGDEINFFCDSIDDSTSAFDFVCANLTLDAIVPILPLLIERSHRLLVLSGILTEQRSIIQSRLLEFEISNFRFEKSGEWLAVQVEAKAEEQPV